MKSRQKKSKSPVGSRAHNAAGAAVFSPRIRSGSPLSIWMLCALQDPPKAHNLLSGSLHWTQTRAGAGVQQAAQRELRGELWPDPGEQPGSGPYSSPLSSRLLTLPPRSWRMVPGCSRGAAGHACLQPDPPCCVSRARAQLGGSRPRR